MLGGLLLVPPAHTRVDLSLARAFVHRFVFIFGYQKHGFMNISCSIAGKLTDSAATVVNVLEHAILVPTKKWWQSVANTRGVELG